MRSQIFCSVTVLTALLGTGVSYGQTTFTVNTANELDDGICDAAHCSLREAIIHANANAGLNHIHFNIAGATPHTIQLLSALPTITDPVVLDGTTQLGFIDKPVVELDGSKTSAGTPGLRISGGGSTVRGLAINRFMGWSPYGDAIVLVGLGGNVIEGNFIGTDVTGTQAWTNAKRVDSSDPSSYPGRGIFVDNSSNNRIGGSTAAARNVISGNYRGIQISGSGATGNLIQGNFVGTDFTGTVALGNGTRIDFNGKELYNLNVGVSVVAADNTIGGHAAGTRNVISGNGWGVSIGCGQNNAVRGNFVGTNVTGTTALSNVETGVKISAIGSTCITTGNVIGGLVSGSGNLISGNGRGIEINSTDGGDVSGTLVQGNYIGTDVTGTVSLQNIYGVELYGRDARYVTIGGSTIAARNVIAGNQEYGVGITSARNNQIRGNYIGTDASGSAALPNEIGVRLAQEMGPSTLSGYNTIGGTTQGEGNVISGNTKYGVYLAGAENNAIQGNFVGTDATGTASLKNGSGIVLLTADGFGSTLATHDNTIGGMSAAARNVISGNEKYGIYLGGAAANQILGNYVGTNSSGTAPLANGVDGITIVDGADNVIGDPSDGGANVIAGNVRVGVLLSGPTATGNVVRGNYIGTNAVESTGLGNGKSGVRVDQGSDNEVGGAAVNAGNVIAFNGGAGVVVSSGGGNAILSNRAFSNGGLGIDLGAVASTSEPDGVTPNDTGDIDVGPNHYQNFPVLSSYSAADGTGTVEGTLNSLASKTFRIELFSNVSCDASNHGEGESLLSWKDVVTDGSGNTTVSMTFAATGLSNQYLTATATDPDGNTSEFSQCYEIVSSPPVADANGPYGVDEGGTVTLDASGCTDPDGDIILYRWDLDNDGEYDDATGVTTTFSAVGLDGPSIAVVAVRVTDEAGNTDTDQAEVTVRNVAPAVGVITGPTDPVPIGTAASFGASFTDPGLPDTHTAQWAWGDGTTAAGSLTQGAGLGSVVGNHAYTTPGIYTVTLTVSDDDGGSGAAVFQYVVVYDPNAGFVTGGGWIDSPAGAYVPDPALTGKATFAFVSRYVKNRDVPTGNTQFRFHAADVAFASDSYDWLVVANHKAVFKGVGAINDGGNYGFQLSAVDADLTPSTDVDLFRIRIWDRNDGDTIVYDNETGSGENAEPTTAIAGGSIVIHDGKSKKVEEVAEIPTEFALHGNYPNPFNPSTSIRFDLPQANEVRLVVFDLLGREVATVLDTAMEAGKHAVTWDAVGLPSGVYLYRLKAGDFVETRQLVLLK